MTNELKPCPFCGGEAGVGWTDFDSGVIFVECEICGMYCEPKDCYANESKAIEAWNTRAERTCQIIKPKKLPYLDKEMMCSECGKLWLEKGVDNYCPSCGAKVATKDFSSCNDTTKVD